jgi:Family of unknown function (DUF6157)
MRGFRQKGTAVDLNYYNTLIAIADDCPVTSSVVPAEPGARVTIAGLQYRMLADNPYVYTQEDILFQTWYQRQDLPEQSPEQRERLRHEFFSKPQACLRSSPLPKKFGWGLLFDEHGRVALCPASSPIYTKIINGQAGRNVKVLKALRSKRA